MQVKEEAHGAMGGLEVEARIDAKESSRLYQLKPAHASQGRRSRRQFHRGRTRLLKLIKFRSVGGVGGVGDEIFCTSGKPE